VKLLRPTHPSANTKMVRLSGRCVRGERLVDLEPQGHWKTITFVAALRQNGMTAPCTIDAAMTATILRASTQTSVLLLASKTFPAPRCALTVSGITTGGSMTLGSRKRFRCTRGLWVIIRSPRSPQEFVEVTTAWLSVPGSKCPFVQTRSSEPEVIAAPTIAAKYQPLTEDVAADLRRAYELCASPPWKLQNSRAGSDGFHA
jgi:hypothetical protein